MKSNATKTSAPKPDRRGRPRLAEARATKVIGIRVTEDDFAALNAYAAAQQTSVAELLRPALAALLDKATAPRACTHPNHGPAARLPEGTSRCVDCGSVFRRASR